MLADPTRASIYNDANKAYQNALAEELTRLKLQNINAQGPTIFYKRGGTLRSAQEQIAIDSNKHAKKSTAKLSDNLMKMLQQLIK